MEPPPRRRMRHGQAGGTNRWKQRVVERLTPFRVRGIHDGGAAGQPDVIDEDVETAEGFGSTGDNALDPVGQGYILGDRQDRVGSGKRIRRHGPQSRSGLRQPCLIAGTNRDETAFRDERGRAGQPQAPARPRDDGDSAGETQIHG